MQLLVSVVHHEEVGPAVAGGADIIDVKNPREGSLGANFPHVIRHVLQLTPPGVPVSAAIGDAPNLPGMAALAATGAASCGVRYVKIGLMGSREPSESILLLASVCRAAREQDPTVRIMATAYADADKVGALSPQHLPSVATRAGQTDACWTRPPRRMLPCCLSSAPVSYTHLRAHETKANLVCRLLLEKKKKK